MSKLIAMVATAVLINGERTIIQPGQPLPDLSEHDERELTNSGAALNPDDEAALLKARSAVAKQAEAEFEAARERVQQAQASTASTADPAKPGTHPAKKTAARK